MEKYSKFWPIVDKRPQGYVAGLLILMTLTSTAQLVCFSIGIATPDLIKGVFIAEQVAIEKCPFDPLLLFNFTDLQRESLDQNVTFSIGYFVQTVDGNHKKNTAEELASVLAWHVVGLLLAFASVVYTLVLWRKLHFALNRRVKEKSCLKTCLACACCSCWGGNQCCNESDVKALEEFLANFLDIAKTTGQAEGAGVCSAFVQLLWLLFIKFDCEQVQLSWGEYLMMSGIVLGSVGFIACKILVRDRLHDMFEQGGTNDHGEASDSTGQDSERNATEI